MGVIQELSKDVIEKIAAGEVVERPASVVKELVENAIDAGAREITVEIVAGGKERIAVIDDGSGMDASDLTRCVLRHATSKIRGEPDLWNIHTMGFRGEALAAIGAVSKLSIESRLDAEEMVEGARIEVEGGALQGPIPAGCAVGTRIAVKDLFYNVPARQKFLRSANVEMGHIIDAVESASLAFPQIRFDLVADGHRKLSLLTTSTDDEMRALTERAIAVLGEKHRENLIPLIETSEGIAVRGVVGIGGKSGGKDLYVLLNRRPIRDRVLLHAITQGLGERIPQGQGPVGVLWIDIDPWRVDVNVHPAKREVRFVNSGAVHDFIHHAVRKHVDQKAVVVVSAQSNALLSGEVATMPRPPAFDANDHARAVGRAVMRFEERRLTQPQCSSSFTPKKPDFNAPMQARSEPGVPVQLETAVPQLRPLGQFARAYIVCEDREGDLVLIDQHAAHERLGFDCLQRQHAEGSVPQQRLLMPEHLNLGEKAAAYLLERIDLLHEAGFEVEPFGGGSLLIKAVPALLGNASVREIFEQLAHEFEELGSSAGIDTARDRIFAVTACHRQVRAGDDLRHDEMISLIRDIERHHVTTCPHGRPALVRIERSQIEKWFKRS